MSPLLLLSMACTKQAAPLGPHGLPCEGRTAVLVEPEPWTPVTAVLVNGQPGPQVVLSAPEARAPLTLQLDEIACTVTPAATGGETGICGDIGVALHYTPQCELAPSRAIVATTRSFTVDTTKRCLPNTHSIGDAEREGHQTCGGRPPGDSAEDLPAIPFRPTFPYLER